MPRKLTEDFCQSLRPDGRNRIFFDAALPGFGLRTTAAGGKVFIARVRVGGIQRYVSIGDCGSMKLAEARREAKRALEAIREGRDPVIERRLRESAVAAGQKCSSALNVARRNSHGAACRPSSRAVE